MIFLRAKHWQLFLVSWGPVSLFLILMFSSLGDRVPYLSFDFALFLFVCGLSNSFAWVWLIVARLKKMSSPMRFGLFSVAFWIPCVYIHAFVFFMLYNFYVRKVKSINPEVEMVIFLSLLVISIGCIFYGLVFIGRLIKAVELGRSPAWKEHLLESLLMLFPPIGLWFIQPKVNRIVAKVSNSYS
jgi:hypothetical protein